jgi:hypothetical protein
MRDLIFLIMIGAALIFSALAYQRGEELADIVYRLEAQVSQDEHQRNRVVTLGGQLERLLRSMGSGSGKKTKSTEG